MYLQVAWPPNESPAAENVPISEGSGSTLITNTNGSGSGAQGARGVRAWACNWRLRLRNHPYVGQSLQGTRSPRTGTTAEAAAVDPQFPWPPSSRAAAPPLISRPGVLAAAPDDGACGETRMATYWQGRLLPPFLGGLFERAVAIECRLHRLIGRLNQLVGRCERPDANLTAPLETARCLRGPSHSQALPGWGRWWRPRERQL
jgi:hypothetical protein